MHNYRKYYRRDEIRSQMKRFDLNDQRSIGNTVLWYHHDRKSIKNKYGNNSSCRKWFQHHQLMYHFHIFNIAIVNIIKGMKSDLKQNDLINDQRSISNTTVHHPHEESSSIFLHFGKRNEVQTGT